MFLAIGATLLEMLQLRVYEQVENFFPPPHGREIFVDLSRQTHFQIFEFSARLLTKIKENI